MFRFEDPQFLYLLLVVPFLVFYELYRMKKGSCHLLVPSTATIVKIKPSLRTYFAKYLFLLKILVLSLVIVAAARPQSGTSHDETKTKGIDIVIAIDSSTSMLAEDFQPDNRLKVAKDVAAWFIDKRRHDRIGLVTFAAKSYTKCPPTLDYRVLKDLLAQIETGQIEDGTAIGMALANATNRLKESEAKSRIIILVTDGRNNKGKVDPVTAAKLAAALDIKIYSIGVGSRGEVPYPYIHPLFGKQHKMVRIDIDEETLSSIAETTGGEYFRATDRESLENIFKIIDKLEKTEIKSKTFVNYTELFPDFLIPAMFILAIYILLSTTILRKLP